MATLFQDVRYGFRMLRKNLGYTVVAVAALALGIGSVSTMFSSIDAVLLRPMAYRDMDSLVAVYATVPKDNADHLSISPAEFEDWRTQNHVFSDVAARTGWEANLTGQGEPELVQGQLVTASYFNVLGVSPVLGRGFVPADAANDTRVVVLANGFWKRRLGADPNIVNKTLTLNGQNYTVAGVMAEEVEAGEDLWRPLALPPSTRADRANRYLDMVARVKPGVSVRDADAEMKTVAARLAQQYPQTDSGRSTHVWLMREELTFGTRQYVLTLLGAAIFVLLLACANVANLQLARTIARQKEIAVRAALGANRWRLVRQILIESVLLGALGGVLGLLLAAWGIDLTRSAIPAAAMRFVTVLRHIELDARVVVFTLAVSVGAGILSGLVAALHASRANVNEAMKEGGRSEGASSGRRPIRASLVVTEVALALVLLVGAGLMVRGFRSMLLLDQGYEPKGVLTMRVSLQRTKYADENKRRTFYDEVVKGLQTLPGVEAAASANFLPASGWSNQEFRIEGRPEPRPGEQWPTGVQSVSPDYLRTMEIPLVRGRFVTAQDGPETTPVIAVGAHVVQLYFPKEDPIGKRIRLLEGDKPGPWRTIVGVVGDVKWPFDRWTRLLTYVPLTQLPTYRAVFAMRTSGDPTTLAAAARAQVRQADPEQAVYEVQTMEALVGDQISGVRIASQMMMVFAFVALLLAGAGIYAVMAYSVAQRTHEIGVRMALGASQGEMRKMIIVHVCKLSGIGLAIGIAGAIVVSRTLSSILFGVLDLEPLTFAALVVLLAAISVLAGYVPAHRASKVDPMVALRYE